MQPLTPSENRIRTEPGSAQKNCIKEFENLRLPGGVCSTEAGVTLTSPVISGSKGGLNLRLVFPKKSYLWHPSIQKLKKR
jgi:hypothetical protein